MRLHRIFSVFAVSAAIIGCSSAKAPPTQAATGPAQNAAPSATSSKTIANPCSLATVDEVSAVMGRKSKPGEFKQAFKGNRCDFHDASFEYDVFLQTVDWNLAAPVMTPENTVAGIGDKAFWSYGSVYVLKNGYGLMIGFQLPHVLPALTPDAKKFAQTVASRM